MPLSLVNAIHEFESKGDPVSPIIEYSAQTGYTTTRMYDVSWADLKEALAQIIGYPKYNENDNANGGGKIHRLLPLRDPWMDKLVATQILRVQGVGSGPQQSTPSAAYEDKPGTGPGTGHDGEPDGGMTTERGNKYPKARITVHFSRPNYRILTDEFIHVQEDNYFGREFNRFTEVSTTIENSYAAVSSTQNLLQFTGVDGTTASGLYGGKLQDQFHTTLKEPPPRVFAEANLTIKWHQVPYTALPWSSIRYGVGKINDVNFGNADDKLRYWAARRLLFIGGGWEPMQLADGNWGWTVTYYFKYREIPWTHFFNPYEHADRDFYPVTIGTRFDNNYPLSTVTRAPEVTSPGTIPFAGYIAPDPNDFTYNPFDFRLLFDPRLVSSLSGNPGG